MKSENILPFYFPTVVVFIDDDEKFLNHLALNLDRDHFHRLYSNPKMALNYLIHEYSPNSVRNHYLREDEDAEADNPGLSVNIRDICKTSLESNRFNEISVIVLDFAMPGLNGSEVAEKLKDYPFKIILLTGEADAQLAVQLFNHGIIHSFIRKDDPQFDIILNKAIRQHQREYFQEASVIIRDTLSNNSSISHLWIKDDVFKLFFDKICEKNQIIEYYLLDEHGSYLLFDEHGKPSWLAVSNEEMMRTYLLFAEGDNAPRAVIDGLKEKKLIPFFFSEDDFAVRPSNWAKYMYPAQMLLGKETYYYSYIKDSKTYNLGGKILSYDEFLQAQ